MTQGTQTANLVLAHQGGWDEVLLVAVPVLFVGGLLVRANRRVKARLDEMNGPNQADET